MSVFEVGKTISESTGGHASAGGNSGAGNRFYFSDDAHAELGLQMGNSYNARIRFKGNTSGFIKLTMIGHRGYAPNAIGNSPFCYIVEALPQQMGTRTALSSTTTGITTKSFEDGIEAQHLMGLDAGDFYPTVSCFQYTDYTEIILRVMNMSVNIKSSDNRSNVKDTTATDHSAALTKHYAGQSDVTVAGQAGEMGGDAIFFTAYIEGYSYNSTLSEGVFTFYTRLYGGRGMIGGGAPGGVDIIEYIAIPVLGNSVDFGNLSQGRYNLAACSDGSRGVWGGGRTPTVVNTIDYVGIGSLENAKDFGNITVARHYLTATSDGNRGIFGSGTADYNAYDYITINTTGDALDFAEPFQGRENPGGASNGDRAVWCGGYTNPPGNMATIDYLKISVLTDGLDFGDLQSAKQMTATSDGSRAVTGGGSPGTDEIDYFDIATTGNAADFGNLTESRYDAGSTSDGSRAVFVTGYDGSTSVVTIDYITIGSRGNALAFGSTPAARQNPACCSGD